MDILDFRFASAVPSAACFALSTFVFKHGIDTGDQRFTMAASAILFAGYAFYLQLLQGSMASAVVLTSMLSQIFALMLAFLWFQEPVTFNKGLGLVLALGATLAFSMPEPGKL